jgi:uncharacterized membrane protein
VRKPTELVMPDGKVIWALVESSGPSDVALSSKLETLQGWTETLQGVAANVKSGLEGLRPDTTTVEFGLEIAAGKSGLIAALCGVGGSAAVKVTLSWNGGAAESDSSAETAD